MLDQLLSRIGYGKGSRKKRMEHEQRDAVITYAKRLRSIYTSLGGEGELRVNTMEWPDITTGVWYGSVTSSYGMARALVNAYDAGYKNGVRFIFDHEEDHRDLYRCLEKDWEKYKNLPEWSREMYANRYALAKSGGVDNYSEALAIMLKAESDFYRDNDSHGKGAEVRIEEMLSHNAAHRYISERDMDEIRARAIEKLSEMKKS